MYADRHARPEGIKPGSLMVAIGINAAFVGALMFAAPVIDVIKKKAPFEAFNVPVEAPPPPPDPIETKVDRTVQATDVRERIVTTPPIVDSGTSDFVLPPLPFPTQPPFLGGEATRIDPPVAPPVLVEARVDPRYAGDLQPQYPAGERRAEREGTATVRVTIGRDGRVTGAECVRATSEEFCRVTRAQALAKWRFTPATRDGAAVETSQVMTVRFELES